VVKNFLPSLCDVGVTAADEKLWKVPLAHTWVDVILEWRISDADLIYTLALV